VNLRGSAGNASSVASNVVPNLPAHAAERNPLLAASAEVDPANNAPPAPHAACRMKSLRFIANLLRPPLYALWTLSLALRLSHKTTNSPGPIIRRRIDVRLATRVSYGTTPSLPTRAI